MSITPEREEVMNFSVPYFDANFALVVPSGSAVTKLEDLSGKKVAGQASTTGLDYLNDNQAKFGYEVVEYTGFDLQSQALLTGQVDAALNDTPVFKNLLAQNPDAISIVTEYESGDSYGVGMKKGNDALTKVFDSVITDSKANGEYKAIYEEWIGPYAG
jgi:polar amino acid transport system substrate-binding protein